MNLSPLLGLRAFVRNLISREISSDFKIQITIFKTIFLFFGLKGKKKFNAEKKELKLSKEKESRSDFSFNLGGVFNIFVTLSNYCGGYPRVRGVRKIVHGYQRGDEFPTWLFAGARCVFVYTKYDLCPLEGEHTRNSYVWEYINLLLYI